MTLKSILKSFGAGLLALALICGVSAPLPVHAQVVGGTISGTITDSSGGAIPNAKVTIKNIATGIARSVTTNSDGYYTASNLLPGSYEVTISAQGFNTEVKRGIELTVGGLQTLNLTMQVGTITKTVEVTTEAPTVQLSTSDISATVNATTVRELPLNGRSWTDLATLQAGVDAIQTQPSFAVGADRGNRGFGQQLTISGARPQQNNYRLDGASLNDYANGGPGSVLGGNLGVDAIQEFSVLTSNYSAEYGKTSGGVVNAVTRSGANSFHGSAYEFLRNSALDARNFFDAGTIPAFKRNQFGGSVGGPIVKDHTFFFADYEGVRQGKGISTLLTVPSLNARNGILANGNPPVASCAAIPNTTLLVPGQSNVCIHNSALLYFPLYPKPNGPVTSNPDNAQFTFAGQQVVNENFLTARIDHKFTDKDSLFGTYVFDRTPYSAPDSFDNVMLGSLTSRQIAVVEETHTFNPGLVNSIRFGFNHAAVNNNQGVSAINPAAKDPTLASFAGRTAAQVQISSGLSPLPGGVGSLPTYYYNWNSFQLYDDAFLSRGTHTIKFGGVVERMLLEIRAFSDPNGIWQFKNLTNFLTNNPRRIQGGVVSTVTPRHLRTNLFGAYVQDDWRVRPNFTLNLGLRYEMSTVPTEANGKLANLRKLTDATAHLGDPFFSNPTLKNFEPRVGFAWDPLHNGKLAVRGGYGMFDVLPLPYQYILLTTLAAPFFQYTIVKDPPAPGCTTCFTSTTPFFSGLPSTLPSSRLRTTFVEPNPKRNYVMQWNLNVQYQLTPNLSAMVAYVGSRGLHQPFRVDDSNQILPTLTPQGYLWPQVDAAGNLTSGPNVGLAPEPFNPTFNSVRGMFYQGRSYYDAMELQVSKRMSHGFQMQGVYTWGKSIDTSSATVAGDAFGNSISSLNYFDPKVGRGVADYNIGRTLVLSGTWQIPTAKSFTGPARWITDGWQLGLIFTASDGVPFTATWGTGSDPANSLNNDDWAYIKLTGGPGCKSLTNPGNPNNYIKTQCFSVPTAPNLAFWNANCDPVPLSLGLLPGQTFDPLNPANPAPGFTPQPQLPALPCFNLRGNAGRNILVGPGITEVDFSVFKNNYIRKISENFNIQFRAEFFNLFNHANFAPPTTPDNTDIFDGTGTSTGVAGLLSRTTTTAREIQFAIKIIF
ncbi:MAG TPA: TonB-dependent receptor [Candidatus Acidoferrum sp.]|nr:TonB-dependent receptor [Candidatus Acidoferrum sp.]